MSNSFNFLKRISYKEQVARSISWGHYFIFLNILLACVVGFSYVYAAPPTNDFVSFFYLMVSWIGHMSFLMVVCYLVIFFPLAFIGNFRYYRVLLVFIAVLLHTILLFDIKIFLLTKVHLSLTALNLIVREFDFDTGLNYNFLFIAVPLVVAIEAVFAKITTHSLYKEHHPYFVRSVLAIICSCFVMSHILHIWADATKYERVTVLRYTFPLHYPMTAKSFLSSHGWLNEDSLSQIEVSGIDNIAYPLSKIESTPFTNPANILLIAVNGLSFDNLSAQHTPNLWKLKQQSTSYNANYLLYPQELDNLFSLSYGLPLQYRKALLTEHVLPVITEELFRQDYLSRVILSNPQGTTAEQEQENQDYFAKVIKTLGLRLNQFSRTQNDLLALKYAKEHILAFRPYNKNAFAFTIVLNDLRYFHDQSRKLISFDNFLEADVKVQSALLEVLYKIYAKEIADTNKLIDKDLSVIVNIKKDEQLSKFRQQLLNDFLNKSQDNEQALKSAQVTAYLEEQSLNIQNIAQCTKAQEHQKQYGQQDDLMSTLDPELKAFNMYEHTLIHVDEALGEFLAELKQHNVLDNTIVVITSLEGNYLLSQKPATFDRKVQHVPLLILYPSNTQDEKEFLSIDTLSYPADISVTLGKEILGITTSNGNFSLGENLKALPQRDYLISDHQQELILIRSQETTIYSQDGSSFVELKGKRAEVRPNLEDLIQATRDLNRYMR